MLPKKEKEKENLNLKTIINSFLRIRYGEGSSLSPFTYYVESIFFLQNDTEYKRDGGLKLLSFFPYKVWIWWLSFPFSTQILLNLSQFIACAFSSGYPHHKQSYLLQILILLKLKREKCLEIAWKRELL